MKKYSAHGSSALLASASVFALLALSPALASAQAVDVGAAGQALTAGTVSTATGSIVDQGLNAGVSVTAGAVSISAGGAIVAGVTGIGAASTGSGVARLSADVLLGAPGSRSDTLKVRSA